MNNSLTNAPNKTPHIAIVGGGMVGISLAIMLSNALNKDQQQSSVNISLIEKFAFPNATNNTAGTHTKTGTSFDARSTALSAGSVALLEANHCWESLKDFAEPIRHIHISDRGHYYNTLLDANDYHLDALGYVIENSRLGQGLLQQLEKTTVQCIAPATVEHCRLKKHGAELCITQDATTTQLDVDLVLIADGADSALRQKLGIGHTVNHYQQTAIITNVALAKPHNGIAYERFTSQGPLALLPLNNYQGETRASVVWTRDTAEAAPLMSLDDDAFLAKLQDCFGYRAGHFTRVGQRHAYPLQLTQAQEQVRSNVVVVGNAAHFLHPVAGQGFNLSLRDCAALAHTLQEAWHAGVNHHIGDYSVLKHYLQRRETDQQLTVALTDAMVKTFSSQRFALSVLRQLGLSGLNTLRPAKDTLAQQMMGIQ